MLSNPAPSDHGEVVSRIAKNISFQSEDIKALDLLTIRFGIEALNADIPGSEISASWVIRAMIAYATERFEAEPHVRGKTSPFASELISALHRHTGREE